VAVICAAFYFWPNDEKATEKPVIVTAFFQQLSASYNENAVAFNAKYNGKLFSLQGKVINVSDTLAGPNVMVYEDALSQYSAIFKNNADVVSLKPGDQIAFTCDSFDLGMQMDGCTINR
jgi:hypothetical protein